MMANLRDIGRQQSEIKINSYRQASFGSPDRQLKPGDFEGKKTNFICQLLLNPLETATNNIGQECNGPEYLYQ